MKLIENQIFYHIQRKVSWNKAPFWNVNETKFIGKDKNPFFETFDYACPKPDPESIAIHYMKLVREMIFEEVRKDFFPMFPSRTRCLWVLPDNKEALKYWWKELNVPGCEQALLKLSLTGKIYEANQYHLRIDRALSLDLLRERAFKYWSGTAGENPFESEVLFEGFAQVLEVDFNPNIEEV